MSDVMVPWAVAFVWLCRTQESWQVLEEDMLPPQAATPSSDPASGQWARLVIRGHCSIGTDTAGYSGGVGVWSDFSYRVWH